MSYRSYSRSNAFSLQCIERPIPPGQPAPAPVAERLKSPCRSAWRFERMIFFEQKRTVFHQRTLPPETLAAAQNHIRYGGNRPSAHLQSPENHELVFGV